MSSVTSASTPQSRLERVTALYDRNLFLQAYQECKECWTEETRLSGLSVEELILGLRLAARMGASRLGRWLGREAIRREPANPKVRYYTWNLQMRGRRYFDHLRQIEIQPELEGADADTQMSWLSYSAVHWAYLRDFDNAHRCLSLARKHKENDAWLLSCESDVLACEDRWEEALAAAEAGWAANPGTPYGARSLSTSLLNLRRVEEAAERLTKAAREYESYEVASLACWYFAALAEMRTGEERLRAISTAQQLVDTASSLAVLADRETRVAIARTRLDLAELADDHAGIEHWAREVQSPFHRVVVENIRKNPDGARIRLPFHHAIQKHNECLPTSIGSAMAAMQTPIDADAMAAELTFGGTPEWAAGDWLEKQGYVVRFFVATPEVTTTLIKHGFAYSMTLEWDTNAHAVAVVGLDEAARTVMVHDPGSFRSTEYLLDWFGKDQAPLGPRAMIAVSPERGPLLDQLLPPSDAETISAREAHRRAGFLKGPAGAREVIAGLAAKYPDHPNTRLLQALQDSQDGRIGAASEEFKMLLEEFPGCAFIRSNLLAACRLLRNTALMRSTLAGVVERGFLPGVESQQQWRYPPSDYVSEYADLLRLSGATRGKARMLFLDLIGRSSYCASAWHNFADLLWNEREREDALLAFRIASCLDDRNEHYARAYSDMLARMGREEEGFAWLGLRVLKFGNTIQGAEAWHSLLGALENAGYPERAMAVAEDALQAQPGSAELLGNFVAFQARMGNWKSAEELLNRLEQSRNNVAFHKASSRFHGTRGELDQALSHAEMWLAEVPLSMTARDEIVSLIAQRDGAAAAIAQARKWVAERPGHEEVEELYCRQLNLESYSSWGKYSTLLRRVKRNREDGWAWVELAFCAIYDFESAQPALQHRLEQRIVHYLAECDRTSPGEPATLRAHAEWLQAQGQWQDAVNLWQEAIDRDPVSLYSYQHLWDCAARTSQEQQRAIWSKLEGYVLQEPGHSSTARKLTMLAAQRFGVNVAEDAVARWIKQRPDDPEIVEAYIDLLLQHGHGRTDDERALQLLLPELKRFPFHLGLRLSQANALQNLRRFEDAEEVFREIVRRHPANTWSRIQLAWMKRHRGETEAAFHELEEAAIRDPQNTSVHHAKVEILIQEQRLAEARTVIADVANRLPAAVGWREDAIRLLLECGDLKQAIETARRGVIEHPRGAYLWLLLGRTLSEHREFAAPGEIELCLRRSLSLNQSLYEAADYLVMFLVDQRRYAEAEQVLADLEGRMADPSPALGRKAWIRRRKGEKSKAVDEMMTVLHQFPWYDWGWGILLEWLKEDQNWSDARTILKEVPAAQRTNTRFRNKRLELLGKAGADTAVMDSEWDSLLGDFPEEIPIHLLRYDDLWENNRKAAATEVLRRIRTVYPESPYVLARWVEVLLLEQKKEEAIASLARLFFAETEPSVWPPNYAWEAIKSGQCEQSAYEQALAQLLQKRVPTPRAMSILAAYGMERFGTVSKDRKSFLRAFFPHRGAREVLRLLKMVDAMAGDQSVHRATLLRILSDYGYEKLVVQYWNKHRSVVDGGVESWSETVRALTGLKKYRAARKILVGWRKRKGVRMWVIANYVMGLSGITSRQLAEIVATCQAALAGLPHDHCARYLAYREAEACVLLGDREGFAECWKEYREYFDGKLEKDEWFEPKRRYLMADLPALARYLENNETRRYKAGVRRLRVERIKLMISSPNVRWSKQIEWRWLWWLVWLILWILIQLSRYSNQ